MRRLKASSIPHLIIKRVVSKKGHRRIVYPHRRIEKGAQENRLPTTVKTVMGRFAAVHGGSWLVVVVGDGCSALCIALYFAPFKARSSFSKRAELVMGERCCTGRPEGGMAYSIIWGDL